MREGYRGWGGNLGSEVVFTSGHPTHKLKDSKTKTTAQHPQAQHRHCKHTSTKHLKTNSWRSTSQQQPTEQRRSKLSRQTPRTYLESFSEGRAACIADSVVPQVQRRQDFVVL